MALQLGLDVSLGQWATVPVHGELDLASARVLEAHVERLVGDDAVWIALDLSDLTFVDSSGMAALARVRDRLRAVGGDVVVVDPPRCARRVATLLGLAFSTAPAAGQNAAV